MTDLTLSPRKAELFWAKVDKTETCWVWTGALSVAGGYGQFRLGDRKIGRWSVAAHRVSYAALVGPIPEGLVLDHLCRNRACVNPDHLEAVTQQVNALRGIGPTAVNAVATHCKHGHEFSDENTYWPPHRPGTRSCRTCTRIRNAEFKAAARAARKAEAA